MTSSLQRKPTKAWLSGIPLARSLARLLAVRALSCHETVDETGAGLLIVCYLLNVPECVSCASPGEEDSVC